MANVRERIRSALLGDAATVGTAGAATDAPALPRNLMIVLSLAQGAALLALWRSATEETWPLQTPALNYPLWTFTILWPALLLLSLEVGNIGRVVKLASIAAAVAVALGVYAGWQATPFGEFPVFSLLAVYVLTLLVASFWALMVLQQFASGATASYATLFARSWRNFLVVALSGALTAGMAVILALWGALFRAIGIDFFAELFEKDWFLFPVLAVAFGLGAFIFRRLTRVIDAIVSLLEGLMRLLLPLLGIVVAIFLATLPFTGLAPLWATGSGTALLMALNAFTLFAVNAVYQTGQRSPYPLIVHRALYGCIALLPIISALALYGLALRVEQHGWTVARCWALTLALLLAAFSVGYAWSIVRRRDGWAGGFAQVNTGMGWAVLALMLLVNTPLLDFRSISLTSQFGRLEAGEIDFMDFDFNYVETHLARPGWLKRNALIEEYEESDPLLAERIRYPAPSWSNNRIWERMVYRPEPFELPPGLRAAIARTHPLNTQSALVRVDLNEDDNWEYAVLFGVNGNAYIWGELFYLEGCETSVETATGVHSTPPDDAPPMPMATDASADNGCGTPNGQNWRTLPLREVSLPPGMDAMTLLREGEISTVAPEFRRLKIGEVVFRNSR